MEKKEKVLFIYAQDMETSDAEELAKLIHEADLPFRFVITNRKLEFLSKEDVKSLIKVLEETIE